MKMFLMPVLLLMLSVSCSREDLEVSNSLSEEVKDTPAKTSFYRFWRGTKLDSLGRDVFIKGLNNGFVQAAPATHAKNGLQSYVAAIPNEDEAVKVPDEIALLAYESEEVYRKAKASPEGKAYEELHWTLFDKTKSASTVPQSFSDHVPEILQADTSYDVIGKFFNWQKGVTTVFVGTRKDGFNGEAFRSRVTRHVRDVARLEKDGLQAYLVLSTDNYEIAYQNWSSLAAMTKAFSSEEGKAIAADASEFLVTNLWSVSKTFAANLGEGEAVNVKFQTRN